MTQTLHRPSACNRGLIQASQLADMVGLAGRWRPFVGGLVDA
jgi:hypothetical protein